MLGTELSFLEPGNTDFLKRNRGNRKEEQNDKKMGYIGGKPWEIFSTSDRTLRT